MVKYSLFNPFQIHSNRWAPHFGHSQDHGLSHRTCRGLGQCQEAIFNSFHSFQFIFEPFFQTFQLWEWNFMKSSRGSTLILSRRLSGLCTLSLWPRLERSTCFSVSRRILWEFYENSMRIQWEFDLFLLLFFWIQSLFAWLKRYSWPVWDARWRCASGRSLRSWSPPSHRWSPQAHSHVPCGPLFHRFKSRFLLALN